MDSTTLIPTSQTQEPSHKAKRSRAKVPQASAEVRPAEIIGDNEDDVEALGGVQCQRRGSYDDEGGECKAEEADHDGTKVEMVNCPQATGMATCGNDKQVCDSIPCNIRRQSDRSWQLIVAADDRSIAMTKHLFLLRQNLSFLVIR